MRQLHCETERTSTGWNALQFCNASTDTAAPKKTKTFSRSSGDKCADEFLTLSISYILEECVRFSSLELFQNVCFDNAHHVNPIRIWQFAMQRGKILFEKAKKEERNVSEI